MNVFLSYIKTWTNKLCIINTDKGSSLKAVKCFNTVLILHHSYYTCFLDLQCQYDENILTANNQVISYLLIMFSVLFVSLVIRASKYVLPLMIGQRPISFVLGVRFGLSISSAELARKKMAVSTPYLRKVKI